MFYTSRIRGRCRAMWHEVLLAPVVSLLLLFLTGAVGYLLGFCMRGLYDRRRAREAEAMRLKVRRVGARSIGKAEEMTRKVE